MSSCSSGIRSLQFSSSLSDEQELIPTGLTKLLSEQLCNYEDYN